jgi:DNA-binding CsgD family transcriptional regulator
MRRFSDGVLEDAGSAGTVQSFRLATLRRLGAIVGIDSAAIIPAGRLGHREARDCVALNCDACLFERFLQNQILYYDSVDLLLDAIIANGGLTIDTEVLGPAERQRLAVYREVLIPAGITSDLLGALTFRGQTAGIVSLSRHRRNSGFCAADLECLRGLLPIVSVADAAVSARCNTRDIPDGAALSGRLLQIARMIAAGLRNKEIARHLGTSPDTVRKQSIQIYQRLGVSGRVQLVARIAGTQGLVEEMEAVRSSS